VLTGPDGTLPPGIAAGGGQDEVWTFTNLEGQPTRRLVAVVDDGPLRARERAFAQRLTLFAGLSAAGALLLGLLLAVGIARPLGELEAAADRVAEGDMSSTVPVRSGGEVGRVLTAFNRMTGELSRARDRLVRAERIAAWRDIARRIAHEIKNPLMPIQTSIETLRKVHQRGLPDFDEIFEESTVTILEEVDRMKRIVSEFSAFARMPRPRPEVFDLREVLEHVVGLHAATDVSVHLDAPEPLTVRADRGQLTQVFVNLVQNGSDAAASRHAGAGQVRIAAFATGGEVVVRVTDDGPGISPEEREKIFEPYYTTKSEGTGLGLAIVHRIVSDHGDAWTSARASTGAPPSRSSSTRRARPSRRTPPSPTDRPSAGARAVRPGSGRGRSAGGRGCAGPRRRPR
jgi:two-component system nitrogen regulation sensor histidine kinase NtrY